MRFLFAISVGTIVWWQPWPCLSCFNGYGEDVSTTNIRGEVVSDRAKGWLSRLTEARHHAVSHRHRGPRFPGQFKDDPVMHANAEAVEVLLDGSIEKSVRMLRQIEAATPSRYETAANLGTALELSGDDEGALKWITEGIRRNRQSHDQSEWIHVRILEAKVALKRDPRWLETNTISGINRDNMTKAFEIETPQGPMVLFHPSKPSVHNAIGWQLNERMSLVKPTDIIVAHLLYELALIEMEAGNLKDAEGELEMAKDYGLPQALLTEQAKRLAPALAEIRRAEWIDWLSSGVVPVALAILLLVALFYGLRALQRLVSD
ncbi:MAG: hypothetical protein JNM99_15590 [Verrucomicrobiaceae bacterium]|nr:hypothetical protein [Verrucomicrobiaceae bacterium]